MAKLIKWFLLASVVMMLAANGADAQTKFHSNINRNKAEGLANKQTTKDCNSRILWPCAYEDLSECASAHKNMAGFVEWWCTIVYVQKNLITRKERVCHRTVGYGPFGGLVATTKTVCQSVDLRA